MKEIKEFYFSVNLGLVFKSLPITLETDKTFRCNSRRFIRLDDGKLKKTDYGFKYFTSGDITEEIMLQFKNIIEDIKKSKEEERKKEDKMISSSLDHLKFQIKTLKGDK